MLINVFQVRGFLLNFGVYYATRAALGLTFEWRSVDSLGLCCKRTHVIRSSFPVFPPTPFLPRMKMTIKKKCILPIQF